MKRKTISFGAIILVLASCGETPALSVSLERLEVPIGADSGEPFLSVMGETVHLSWLEASASGGHDLRFASFSDDRWSEATTIEHSERFFVNWADFPSVTADGSGALWAHWLQRGDEGGYDYGVRVARSDDGGSTWSAPWTPHEDTSPTEHGFVSALPIEDGMGFVWLDGRKYADGVDGAPGTKEMSLRYRTIDGHGSLGAETLIDSRVCDCCQTDAAMADEGPVVVYRNRSEAEIRDIYMSRLVDGAWTKGASVHEDGWEIAGCPVNGPAVAARGNEVAVAWFTAPQDVARVYVAFSSDGGATFGDPTVVDDGNPGGRVDLLLSDDGSALVSWLERTGGENAEVRLRSVQPTGGSTNSVTLTAGSSSRASGFPRMAATPSGEVLLAWTDLVGDHPQVQVTKLILEK